MPKEPFVKTLPRLSPGQARWVKVWTKTEDVAMHFNDLILNFRLKALGAVTLSAGLIGNVLRSKDGQMATRMDHMVFSGGMLLLLLVWFAIAALDFGYYQRLFRGAVAEALRLEKLTGNAIRLSTVIEEEVASKWLKWKWLRFHRLPRLAFYLIPGLGFIVAARLSMWSAPPHLLQAVNEPSRGAQIGASPHP